MKLNISKKKVLIFLWWKKLKQKKSETTIWQYADYIICIFENKSIKTFWIKYRIKISKDFVFLWNKTNKYILTTMNKKFNLSKSRRDLMSLDRKILKSSSLLSFVTVSDFHSQGNTNLDLHDMGWIYIRQLNSKTTTITYYIHQVQYF